MPRIVLNRTITKNFKKVLIWSIIFVVFYIMYLKLPFVFSKLFDLWKKYNFSPEVNAAIITSVITCITLGLTLAITAYFNMQTQKLMIQQQRMNIRDRIWDKRMEIYPEILEQAYDLYWAVNKSEEVELYINKYISMEDLSHTESFLEWREFLSERNNSAYLKEIDEKLKILKENLHKKYSLYLSNDVFRFIYAFQFELYTLGIEVKKDDHSIPSTDLDKLKGFLDRVHTLHSNLCNSLHKDLGLSVIDNDFGQILARNKKQ